MPTEPRSMPRSGRRCFRSPRADRLPDHRHSSAGQRTKKRAVPMPPPARASCLWRPCRRYPCQSASCPLLPCFRPGPVPARGRDRCGQNVTLQLLSVPVSPLPLSYAQVPGAVEALARQVDRIGLVDVVAASAAAVVQLVHAAIRRNQVNPEITDVAVRDVHVDFGLGQRSEEHTSELQSLMRISYAVFCLKKKTTTQTHTLQK